MYLIAGLGNPGKKYEKTRHNMGFDCIDILAGQLGITVNKDQLGAKTGKGFVDEEPVVLIKPQTYMNASGVAIAALVNYYKADPGSELIVIYDDADLDAGHLRIRKKGSAGSHNGMKSVIQCLGGNEEFIRIRVGIGKRPEYMDMISFVLGRFDAGQRAVIDESLDRAAKCAAAIISEGADRAMNLYNG